MTVQKYPNIWGKKVYKTAVQSCRTKTYYVQEELWPNDLLNLGEKFEKNTWSSYLRMDQVKFEAAF